MIPKNGFSGHSLRRPQQIDIHNAASPEVLGMFLLSLNTTPPFVVRYFSVSERRKSGERTDLVRRCFGTAASPNGEGIRENEVRLLLQVIEHLMAVGLAVPPTRDVNPVAAHTETLEKVLATYHYTPHTAKLLMSDVAYLSDVPDKMGDLVEGAEGVCFGPDRPPSYVRRGPGVQHYLSSFRSFSSYFLS